MPDCTEHKLDFGRVGRIRPAKPPWRSLSNFTASPICRGRQSGVRISGVGGLASSVSISTDADW